MKVLFVEPPKDIWFVMGEYLPPPFGIIQLAAYLERELKDVEIKVLDCNAEHIDWHQMEKQISSFNPDILASSALATCNTFLVTRTMETGKKTNPDILTVAGGQHFTATADESLKAYPEIDVIVRGEGERTFTELVKKKGSNMSFEKIEGISFRKNDEIRHTPPRPLISDLNELPYPGYHFVEDLIHRYHFSAMVGSKAPYVLIEGSRGCPYRCTFCSQWIHWQGTWRRKSPERVADEMEFCYENFGSRFIWLTDDNFNLSGWAEKLADEIKQKRLKELMWFTQARCDSVIEHTKTLPKLRDAGLRWMLLGVENSNIPTLEVFNKQITPEDAKRAIKLLQKNDIFAQAMLIIGSRRDNSESIEELREFVNRLDPDFAIFALLTPFPGTKLFEEAKSNGWIESYNWADYDMIHTTMPTETLTQRELQKELYKCYRSFYGSWNRRVRGLFSRNKLKRRIYWYMLGRGIITQLRKLIETR